MNYTAIIKPDGDSWIGWIEEIPGVNCQEGTKGELLESLKTTLIEAIELNKEDARKAAGTNWTEEVVVSTMGLKPSPSGETFRFFVFVLQLALLKD